MSVRVALSRLSNFFHFVFFFYKEGFFKAVVSENGILDLSQSSEGEKNVFQLILHRAIYLTFFLSQNSGYEFLAERAPGFLMKVWQLHASLGNRHSGIYILTGFWKKKKKATGSAKFPPGCLFLLGRCFVFFKYTQIIDAGHVEVTPGKPQTRWAMLKSFTRYQDG